MKTLYESVVKFLYKNFTGVREVKLFGETYYTPKASKIIFPFFVMWGITKLFQSELYFSWLDLVFILLFIPQYIAGFTNIVVKEYNKINKNENSDNSSI